MRTQIQARTHKQVPHEQVFDRGLTVHRRHAAHFGEERGKHDDEGQVADPGLGKTQTTPQ